jgi:arginase
VFEDVSKAVAEELNADRFPFVLAGDHGSAGGTIAGIKQAFPDKRLGVIWIDAHGDLHTPYTTPSGNLHGMPLSTVLNDDNLKCQINNVPQETVSQWEKLKAVGFQGTKVLPEDLVFIAVRDLEKEEQSIIDRLNIEVLTVESVRMNGTDTSVQHVLSKLAACDLIYVSFDVDSMDPVATSYGTGTPVLNGLLPHQAGELLNGLATSPKIACVEFVEVNPCLDEKKNHMAEVAFALVESMAHTLTH